MSRNGGEKCAMRGSSRGYVCGWEPGVAGRPQPMRLSPRVHSAAVEPEPSRGKMVRTHCGDDSARLPLSAIQTPFLPLEGAATPPDQPPPTPPTPPNVPAPYAYGFSTYAGAHFTAPFSKPPVSFSKPLLRHRRVQHPLWHAGWSCPQRQ